MTEGLVLHPLAARALEQCAGAPPHAVLITGSDGIGKTTLAERLASAVLCLQAGQLAEYPYYLRIAPDEKNTISIDAIRRLQKFLQLKTLGDRPVRRIIIIERAGRLTTEAQNAFLKILEEPPADTMLILTAANKRQMLATITSRVQVLAIQPPLESALRGHYEALGHSQTAVSQALFLSGSLPGLLHTMLSDAEHPLFKNVQTAKELLKSTPFERLAIAEPLSKQKDQALAVFQALSHVAQAMLEQSAEKGAGGQIKQWYRILETSQEAIGQLQNSGNTKLILTVAMLRM